MIIRDNGRYPCFECNDTVDAVVEFQHDERKATYCVRVCRDCLAQAIAGLERPDAFDNSPEEL